MAFLVVAFVIVNVLIATSLHVQDVKDKRNTSPAMEKENLEKPKE